MATSAADNQKVGKNPNGNFDRLGGVSAIVLSPIAAVAMTQGAGTVTTYIVNTFLMAAAGAYFGRTQVIHYPSMTVRDYKNERKHGMVMFAGILGLMGALTGAMVDNHNEEERRLAAMPVIQPSDKFGPMEKTAGELYCQGTDMQGHTRVVTIDSSEYRLTCPQP